MTRGRLRAVLGTILAVTALVVSGCTSSSPKPAPSPVPTTMLPAPTATPSPVSPTHPNIVFVLTDDLSWNLVQYMPHVVALQHQGMTFTNFTVTDSLCCPSRASIFTGEFPHDTHIYSNHGPFGGFLQFHRRGEEYQTFNYALAQAGYRTAMMGKYLNEYVPPIRDAVTPGGPKIANYVPPGWTTWDVAGDGYPEYGYRINENHRLVTFGHKPKDYLTTVLQGLADKEVTTASTTHRPFFLEVATFAPHKPYTPAPQDLDSYAGLQAPRNAAYDTLPRHAPTWLAGRPPLTAAENASIDKSFERRVEDVQSVDRMIGSIEQTLRDTGQAQNTVFVFGSDNGYHMGEYRLAPGKFTAFDTDVRVPLIVAGPGIPADSTNADEVENIDLAPTFEALEGVAQPATTDGHSFLPLLYGQNPVWRTLALIEHHGPVFDRNDPDSQTRAAGEPPTYEAMRSSTFTYVRYVDGSHEYYDRATDPDELDNIYASLPKARKDQLDAELDTLQNCHGATACWAAGRPQPQNATTALPR